MTQHAAPLHLFSAACAAGVRRCKPCVCSFSCRSCAAATRYQRLQRTAGNARQRRNATATSCRPRQEQRSPRLSVSAVFADATGFRERQLADAAGAGDAAADSTLQELNAASHDPAAFAAVLHRLTERGGGGTVPTEAHVVAAWAAQRRNPALHAVRGSPREADVMRGLAALEELTRRQLVSLTADQIGFVYRCGTCAAGRTSVCRPSTALGLYKLHACWSQPWCCGLPTLDVLNRRLPTYPPTHHGCLARATGAAGAMSWQAVPPSRCCRACSRQPAAGGPRSIAQPGLQSSPGRWPPALHRCRRPAASCCTTPSRGPGGKAALLSSSSSSGRGSRVRSSSSSRRGRGWRQHRRRSRSGSGSLGSSSGTGEPGLQAHRPAEWCSCCGLRPAWDATPAGSACRRQQGRL